MYTPVNPSFDYIKEGGIRGSKLYRHVFVMMDLLLIIRIENITLSVSLDNIFSLAILKTDPCANSVDPDENNS